MKEFLGMAKVGTAERFASLPAVKTDGLEGSLYIGSYREVGTVERLRTMKMQLCMALALDEDEWEAVTAIPDNGQIRLRRKS